MLRARLETVFVELITDVILRRKNLCYKILNVTTEHIQVMLENALRLWLQ